MVMPRRRLTIGMVLTGFVGEMPPLFHSVAASALSLAAAGR
jgi:hypothetical protein